MSKTREDDYKVLVHCSAGCGRTGTLLSIYILVELAKELKKRKGNIGDKDNIE